MIKHYLLLLMMFFIISCATSNAVYKQDYDFSKIKNVYIEGGLYSSQTQAIKDSIIKQLMTKGFNIKSSIKDADITITYSVTEYQPSKKYLIRKNNEYTSSGAIVIYNDRPVEVGGSSVYDLGTAFGIDNASVIASNATVGVSLTIKDIKTEDIIWTNSYTYEGLDVTAAVDGVVRYILKEFPPKLEKQTNEK